MAGDTAVRPVRPGDREAWEPLWQGYLTFYKATLPPEQNDLTWARLHDPAEPMHLIGAYVEENKGIEEEIEAVLKNVGEGDELIIFTDLLGGSITNQVLRCTQGRNVHIVSGFNLALLIEVLMADAGTPAGEVIESAIANAKEQLVYVNKMTSK